MHSPSPPQSPKPLVKLTEAGLKLRERWLVHNITLEVKIGEIVTLIGPNGSGKSTIAKMALGIVKPSTGNLWKNANLRVGYMPQHMSIDWTLPLSVHRLMCLTNRLSTKQMTDALAATGVEHLLHAQVRQLSGGELQRVLLARAIARKPDLLVLDEPAQGVDLGGEIALYKLIANIRNEAGCGILLISHDLHMVMAEANRVICVNGHICCEGSPSSVMGSAVYQQLFGEKAAALVPYQHNHDHTHLLDGGIK